jgi:leucyl aminopeptidase
VTDLYLPADAPTAIPLQALRASDWAAFTAGRPSHILKLAEAADFKGQAGRILLVPSSDGSLERVLFGLGEGLDPMAFCAASALLPAGDYSISAPRELSPTLIALAWGLGVYR